ncbi:MAG: PorV/PorQ family protein [Rhodothermales bacterium]|nr:PorV/PorQ family protein [Rhodothermales bacterium]
MSERFVNRAALAVTLVALAAVPASGQRVAKYGADFLAGGVGARALGMGGAHVALTRDVSSGYWNPAGLADMTYPEIAYMHAERFAGVVSFDYGSVAFPINAQSTIGVSFFRSGVNDIKNTLDAWDAERDQPKPNPESFFTSFSAADMAFFVGYARSISDRLSIGITGKMIRRTIGDFADAWGYSFDVGVKYRTGRYVLGANIQDVSTMLQSWSVNQGSLQNIQDVFGQELPEGGTELVLPVARLGSGLLIPIGENELALGLDVDLAFDGQQANVINLGDVSFHPRLGTEFTYRNVLSFRAGVNRIAYSDRYGLDMTPSIGTGIQLRQVAIDYGFGDFAGLVSDLGYSHRISIKLTLEQPGLKRQGTGD